MHITICCTLLGVTIMICFMLCICRLCICRLIIYNRECYYWSMNLSYYWISLTYEHFNNKGSNEGTIEGLTQMEQTSNNELASRREILLCLGIVILHDSQCRHRTNTLANGTMCQVRNAYARCYQKQYKSQTDHFCEGTGQQLKGKREKKTVSKSLGPE